VTARAPLGRGEGAGRVLYLDCSSGLSGDMIVSALVDLGVPLDVVSGAAAALPLSGYRIRTAHETRRSMVVSRFFVDVDDGDQPHRHYADIRDMIAGSTLAAGARDLALRIFRRLAEAEARVHGAPVDDVHFHEVGAVDSIVDIVGAAAAFDHLGAEIVCGPVPLGCGFVKTRHGALPLPAPATLEILAGVPVEGTDVAAELTTPTGAAIVKTVAARFGRLPPMAPLRVGLGAGARCHEERPGVLRAILGEPTREHPDDPTPCAVIEANIDDVTGEIAGHALQRILAEGALDAWIVPIHMKKGRPALSLGALVRCADIERIGALVLAETPTIGLRHYRVGRMEMRREIREVVTPYGAVRVKIARGPLGSANAAPEFEDCKLRAAEAGVPLKRVMAAAIGLAEALLGEEAGGGEPWRSE
jgi:pyridinium-3,5-bisthiocarboxylic acid mononucleotide nickel chelatase